MYDSSSITIIPPMFHTRIYLHVDPTKGTKGRNLSTGNLEDHCSFRNGEGAEK